MYNAEYFVSTLEMEPHIEGGFFKEIYRSPFFTSDITAEIDGDRSLSSTIYYLLRSEEVSKFHRLKFDEIWFYHYGSPTIIHTIDNLGNLKSHFLGLEVKEGHTPQVLIPKNTFFGAEVMNKESFSLVSCMVSPGFSYDDFELFTGEQLRQIFPQHKELITKLNG